MQVTMSMAVIGMAAMWQRASLCEHLASVWRFDHLSAQRGLSAVCQVSKIVEGNRDRLWLQTSCILHFLPALAHTVKLPLSLPQPITKHCFTDKPLPPCRNGHSKADSRYYSVWWSLWGLICDWWRCPALPNWCYGTETQAGWWVKQRGFRKSGML